MGDIKIMSGIICCVCNHKGGVGKTSLTCNLGSSLALKQQRVLIIDNDPQANASGILLLNNTSVKNSLYELLDIQVDPSKKPPIEDCIYPTKHKNLFCLPNVEETSGLEIDFAAHYPKSLNYLKNQVKTYVKNHFDYILIDCPPTLSLFVANALHTSDCAIVPIDAGSAYSLDGLRKVLELIDTIQKNGNPDLRFLRLAINRVDLRTSISKIIIGDVNDRFGENQVFKSTVPVNTSFQQAEYAKETIFNWAPTSRGAAAYRKLANEFLSIFEKKSK